MENILEVKNLSKKFENSKFEISDVSFDVPRGTIFGMIGENSAGKTTILKLIMNAYGRDSGKVTAYGNVDNIRDEPEFKNRTGFVVEDYLYDTISVKRIAQAFSCAFSNWKQEIFDKYINQWNIDITQLCSQLSKGAKIKVMIALALGHQPEMLILDEPTDGLDPHARAELLDIFREFVSDGEKSVIFSTHITSDLDKTADYIAVVSNGKITEVLTADETQEKYAVVSGDKTDGIEKYLIGMKKSEIGYEGLVLRENLAYFDDVTVRNPTYEDILMYTISGKRGE